MLTASPKSSCHQRVKASTSSLEAQNMHVAANLRKGQKETDFESVLHLLSQFAGPSLMAALIKLSSSRVKMEREIPNRILRRIKELRPEDIGVVWVRWWLGAFGHSEEMGVEDYRVRLLLALIERHFQGVRGRRRLEISELIRAVNVRGHSFCRWCMCLRPSSGADACSKTCQKRLREQLHRSKRATGLRQLKAFRKGCERELRTNPDVLKLVLDLKGNRAWAKEQTAFLEGIGTADPKAYLLAYENAAWSAAKKLGIEV